MYIICTAEIAGDTHSAQFFKIYGWSIFEGWQLGYSEGLQGLLWRLTAGLLILAVPKPGGTDLCAGIHGQL